MASGRTQPEVSAAAVIIGKNALFPGIRRGPAQPFRLVSEIAERFFAAETENSVPGAAASRSSVFPVAVIFER